MLITKDLQPPRSEEFVLRAKVSATALLSIIRKYTVSWPDRFGRDKYFVFIDKVIEAFEVLGIRLVETKHETVSTKTVSEKEVSNE